MTNLSFYGLETENSTLVELYVDGTGSNRTDLVSSGEFTVTALILATRQYDDYLVQATAMDAAGAGDGTGAAALVP